MGSRDLARRAKDASTPGGTGTCCRSAIRCRHSRRLLPEGCDYPAWNRRAHDRYLPPERTIEPAGMPGRLPSNQDDLGLDLAGYACLALVHEHVHFRADPEIPQIDPRLDRK